MREPVSENVARGRWIMISLHRFAGVAMVLVGVLALQGVFDLRPIAGYALVAVGLVDIFVVPLVLARMWRSPLE